MCQGAGEFSKTERSAQNQTCYEVSWEESTLPQIYCEMIQVIINSFKDPDNNFKNTFKH